MNVHPKKHMQTYKTRFFNHPMCLRLKEKRRLKTFVVPIALVLNQEEDIKGHEDWGANHQIVNQT